MRERVFLGMGSNVGRRPGNLRRALKIIGADPDVRVVAASFLYITDPLGYTEQRDFVNGVVEVRTRLAPHALLARLREVEERLGKRTPFRNGPRTIDIDLLFYGSRVIASRDLVVPHPRAHLRRFALAPLCDLAPRLVHPRLRRTAARLLRECRDTGRVRRLGRW